jgi:hypothetical protein
MELPRDRSVSTSKPEQAPKIPIADKLKEAIAASNKSDKGRVDRYEQNVLVVGGEKFWQQESDHPLSGAPLEELALAIIDTRVKNGVEKAVEGEKKQEQLWATEKSIESGLSRNSFRKAETDSPHNEHGPWYPYPCDMTIDVGENHEVVLTRNMGAEDDQVPSYSRANYFYEASVISTMSATERDERAAMDSMSLQLP